MEKIYRCRWHAWKKLCKDFEIKNIGEYHDLYLNSDTVISVDVSENFRKMCLKICQLDPAKFLLALRLAWQVARRLKVKMAKRLKQN